MVENYNGATRYLWSILRWFCLENTRDYWSENNIISCLVIDISMDLLMLHACKPINVAAQLMDYCFSRVELFTSSLFFVFDSIGSRRNHIIFFPLRNEIKQSPLTSPIWAIGITSSWNRQSFARITLFIWCSLPIPSVNRPELKVSVMPVLPLERLKKPINRQNTALTTTRFACISTNDRLSSLFS